jgi:hypothetical protein
MALLLLDQAIKRKMSCSMNVTLSNISSLHHAIESHCCIPNYVNGTTNQHCTQMQIHASESHQVPGAIQLCIIISSRHEHVRAISGCCEESTTTTAEDKHTIKNLNKLDRFDKHSNTLASLIVAGFMLGSAICIQATCISLLLGNSKRWTKRASLLRCTVCSCTSRAVLARTTA